MARTQAGLLSLGTTGSFAGSMVFVQAKSGTVIRQHVIPSNPRSPAQTGTRSLMSWASKEWAQLTTLEQSTWANAVQKAGESPFNAFTRAAANLWKNGLFPQSEFPTVTEAAPDAPTGLAAAVSGKQITLSWTDPAARVFGVAIHQSADGVVTPAPSNAVKVVDAGVETTIVNVTAPGTYHFKARAGSHEGIFGAATADLEVEVS